MRILILIAAFLSAFGQLSAGEPVTPAYKTTAEFDGLREKILHVKAETLGAPQNQPVLAVVMETGYAEAVVTLVAVVDGSTSLYISNGGGVMGAGQSPGPNAAAREVVAAAAAFLSDCTLTKEFPLPQKACTRFYLVTPKGVFTAEAKESDLGNRRHRMSPLFHTVHRLITQIRLSGEQQDAEPAAAPNAAPPARKQ